MNFSKLPWLRGRVAAAFERLPGTLSEELAMTQMKYRSSAIEVNDGAAQVIGNDTLRLNTQELVSVVENGTMIDRTAREDVRAQMCVIIKRILRRHGCPRDTRRRVRRIWCWGRPR